METESENITNVQDDDRLLADFLVDLHNFMDQEEVEELNIDTDEENFQITSREQAGFFMRKLQDLRAEQEAINKEADREINRLMLKINAWRNEELKKRANGEAYLISLLENFAEKELQNSDKKSLKLPFGTLSFVKQQDKYDYDDAALLKWLKENDVKEYIRIKEEPNKADLKKNTDVLNGKLLYKGKEVAGVTVTPQEPKFQVK